MRLFSPKRLSWILVPSFFGLLGFVGCSSDNDAAVREQAKATAGAAAPKDAPPMPKTDADRIKMAPNPTQGSMPKGYPGAK